MKHEFLLIGLFVLTGTHMAQAENVKQFDLGTIRPEGAVYDINLSEGRVFVQDLSNNKVLIFDNELNKVNELKDVPSPHGVGVDKEGFLYVGTHRSGSIKKFGRDYNEVADWDSALREHMKAPVALEAGLDKNLYVCDWILQQVIEVTDQGRLVRVFEDAPIKAKAQFQAHGVAVDGKNKRIYVADRGNEGGSGTIHAFSMDGKYLSSWPKPSADFDPFTVRHLTEDLYMVPNYKDGALYIFNAEGALQEKVDVHGEKPGQFQYVTSVVVDHEGFIYGSELNGNRIQKVDFRAVIERLKQK